MTKFTLDKFRLQKFTVHKFKLDRSIFHRLHTGRLRQKQRSHPLSQSLRHYHPSVGSSVGSVTVLALPTCHLRLVRMTRGLLSIPFCSGFSCDGASVESQLCVPTGPGLFIGIFFPTTSLDKSFTPFFSSFRPFFLTSSFPLFTGLLVGSACGQASRASDACLFPHRGVHNRERLLGVVGLHLWPECSSWGVIIRNASAVLAVKIQ